MTASPERTNISEVPKYSGPTSRLPTPPEPGISIADLLSSDRNEEILDKLLSSRSIAFYIERPDLGWKGVRRRMHVTVAPDDYPQVMDLLAAALDASLFEEAEEDEGISWY